MPERRADSLRYRALIEAFSDFVWSTSPDGKLISDMPKWRAVTGQTEAELLGYGWLDGVHPDDRARVQETWEAAVAQRGLFRSTYRLIGPGGPRWLEVRGAPVVDDGELLEWVGTAIDVSDTERLREVEAHMRVSLRRERDMFLHVIERAPLAVAVLDGPDHEFRLFNDAYLDLAPAGRVRVGVTVAEAMPETRDNAVPLLDRAYRGETIAMRELPVPFEDERSFDGDRYYDFIYAPIYLGSDVVGVLVTANEVTERVRSRDDLTRRLDEERRLAEELQRALVPERPPTIDGVELAVRYLPASEAVGVGGDWYDALALDDGHVLLVIGDVCGKGLRAATVMSQLRAAVRAYAIASPVPAEVLGALATYMDNVQLADMVTATVALLDLDACTLELATAGHLPPLLVGADGTPGFLLTATGPPLGAGVREYPSTTVDLRPGDRVVFFTDGAVEHRDRSLADTLEELRAAIERDLAPDAASAAELCTLVDEHVACTGAGLDDTALLVCGLRACGRGQAAAPAAG